MPLVPTPSRPVLAEHIALGRDSLPSPPPPASPPPGGASARGAGGARENYRQMFRIMCDLRVLLEQRNRARRTVRTTRRDAMRRLMLVSARREAGGIEHCLRVGAMSALIADTLGEPRDWCDTLFDAAPVHDLGNLCIPDAILHKSGDLDEREWRIVRDHPLAGARLLGGSNNPIETLAAEIALNHHERWDGSGYPAGRKGSNIPLAARIVAIADFVDALGSASAFRTALPVDHVFDLLELSSGAQFDPRIVPAMHALRPRLPRVRELAAACAPTIAANTAYRLWWREV